MIEKKTACVPYYCCTPSLRPRPRPHVLPPTCFLARCPAACLCLASFPFSIDWAHHTQTQKTPGLGSTCSPKQLGLGAASTKLAPTHNPLLSDVGGGVVSVSAGANHSVCAMASGLVMSWGAYEYCQQGCAGGWAFYFARRRLVSCPRVSSDVVHTNNPYRRYVSGPESQRVQVPSAAMMRSERFAREVP